MCNIPTAPIPSEQARPGDGRPVYPRNAQVQNPVRQRVTPEVRDRIEEALNATLDGNRSALLSELGNALRTRNVDRYAYTTAGLADWIISMFPNMRKSEDGLRIYLNEWTSASIAADYPPAAQNLSMVDMDENIRQMHGLAFMGWWNNNVRTLKRYTGCSGNEIQIWSGIVAQRLSDLLLGCGACIQESGPDGVDRLAFYTGMDTPDGRPVYCVLTRNKADTDGRYQLLMLEAFCCPGDPENPELSAWLQERLEQSQPRQNGKKKPDILQLEAQCAELKTMCAQLLPQVRALLDALESGMELPEQWEPDLRAYHDVWENVRGLRTAVEAPEELTTAEEICAWCAQQNALDPYLRQLPVLFDTMLCNLGQILQKNGITLQDPSDDRTALQQACGEFSSSPETERFRALLEPYHQLLEVMGALSFPDIANITGALDRHFGFSSVQVFCLKMRSEDQYRLLAQDLENLERQLEMMDQLIAPPCAAAQEPAPRPTMEEILADLDNRRIPSLRYAGGANQLERLILEDRLPEAQVFAADDAAMAEAGYSAAEQMLICGRLDDPALPIGRTIYNAGLRLRRVLGDGNDTAEWYFLMGLIVEQAECSAELLRGYRRAGQREKFAAIWSRYESKTPYSAENHIYYLQYLEDTAPDQIRAYLDSRVFLYYVPQCAEAVRTLTDEPAHLTGEPVLNTLEQALAANRRDQIQELLNDRAALVGMGYSDEQITQLSQAAVSDSWPTGCGYHKTGLRIYLYQGNFHGLAERYLWQGLAAEPTAEKSERLICLLADEQRWSECIRLYRCYASDTGTGAASRQAYLLAMLHTEPVKVQQLIRANLQDFLGLAYGNPDVMTVVNDYRTSSNEAFRAFYQGLYQLCALLTEDYPRSVILHDRSLRDMVTQPSYLSALGLEDRQIECARNLYQSGNYPKGADAVSVAKRVYAFMGVYHGAAEKLCCFALPAEEALALLWDISVAAADTQEQALLLQTYPSLRERYPDAYSRCLFDSAQDETLLAWLRQREITPVQRLQQTIAQLRLNPRAEIVPLTLEAPVNPEQTGYLILLSGALARLGRTGELSEFLLSNFVLLLRSCPAEDLKRIMTADGALSADAAAGIQADALARGAVPAALYYYNTLRTGDLAEEAARYYQACTERCMAGEADQVNRMEALAKLYPDQAQKLNEQIYLLKLRDLLAPEKLSKETPGKLAEALENCILDAAGTRSLLDAVRTSPCAGNSQVVQSVARLTDREDLRVDGLMYLHQTAMAASKQSALEAPLFNSLCQRYLDAINQDWFPPELGQEAGLLCRRIIRSDCRLYNVVYCLYRIERMLGQNTRADYVLRYLVTQPANALGSRLYAAAVAEVEEAWKSKVPSILSLFRMVLLNGTPEEIAGYCQFCGIFAEATNEDLAIMTAQIQSLRVLRQAEGGEPTEYSLCTEADAEALIKVLCSASGKADNWWACAGLPGLTPQMRGKLLYICGKNNASMWQACVQFCIASEQNALLLQALREWVGTASSGLKNCRTFLNEALDQDPNFFGRWTEPEDHGVLLDILELLCRDIREDLNTLPTTVAHSALNTVSSIAVGIGSDSAVQILEQNLSEPLLTNYSEVGVATVLKLLQTERPACARRLLEGLCQSSSPIACGTLVNKLGGMTEEALAQWAAAPENQLLIGLLLPDGNRPTAHEIQAFTVNMIRKKRVREGASVLNMLLDNFPGDYACGDALFILCKCGLDDPIPLLHKALCSLISSSTSGATYFRRSASWNAKLLAGVNAVVQARHLERAVQNVNSDYDFNQPAGNYCLLKKPETTDTVEINMIQRNLTSDLENLRTDVLDHKCRGILCWVTGDWTDFLRDAWTRKAGVADVSEIADYLCMRFDKKETGVESIGFCRSLLRVAEDLPEDQRMPFLAWVRLALTGIGEQQRPEPWRLKGKLRHVYLAMDLLNNGVLQKVGDLSLEIPLEEYSLFSLISAEKITPCVGVNPELMFYRLWLLGAVVDYSVMCRFQCIRWAKNAFDSGDDSTAAVVYEAALKLLSRGLNENDSMTPTQFYFNQAQYEACARVSRLMLGDREILAKVSSSKFHVWSCINMTVVLMCTKRGNQAMQMAECFGRPNGRVSQTLIRCANPNLSDAEKLEMVKSFPDGLAKAFLAYVMCRGTNAGRDYRPYFFQDRDTSWKVRQIGYAQAELHREYFRIQPNDHNAFAFSPTKTVITTFGKIDPATFNQLPVTEVREVPAAGTRANQPARPAQVLPLPSFAAGLTPLEQTADLDTLKEEHGRLPHLKRYYRDRLQLSEQIYRMTLSGLKRPEQTLPALIDFGLDYYDYHRDLDSLEELSLAYRAMVEMVPYADSVRSAVSAGENTELAGAFRTLASAVDNTVLYHLLYKGHTSIHTLIDQFAQDRKAFELMQQMIQMDALRMETVNTIYSALDLLVECFSTHADQDVLLREGLIKAQSRIAGVNYGPWQPLRNHLHSLIQSEVSAMDRRPILSLKILNQDQNPAEDFLYGEIRNDGLETAENINLQITFEGSSSDCYRVPVLEPKEHTAFKIYYVAPQDADSLHFVLNWSYMFHGRTYTQPAENQVLPICLVPEPAFPVRRYETETITHFYEDGSGNIVNPNFFGREDETEMLRNLFRSGQFPSYNNAILYGIRRAGKTTLLNYVLKYVSVHCDDAIAVKVDCLNNSSSQLIQSLFITMVKDAIESSYPQYKEQEDWRQLVRNWELPADAADRDPGKLELFYRELKQVTGKGLILMLDEVDNFFTSVERQTSLDSHLFQILSNMLCSPTCQEAVHFIFCGSKYLLRYRAGDGGLSQLFQRFGSNIIEVGLIPKSDMRAMLLKPYEAYPEVVITEEAIDRIWEYTQGMVWHVKLLGNVVMEYVRQNGRSIVYPVDVESKIASVVQKEYCEQFFDGIGEKEKDKYERLVIDAMQSRAASRTTYVPKNDLIQLLTSETLPPETRMTVDQIENALDNLIKLRLVEYSERNKGYRFQVELYRMFFQTQRIYPFMFRRLPAADPSFSRV